MALLFLFLLGIANFAMCKAVLESGHPLLGSQGTMRLFGGRVGLTIEFVVLAGSMLMVASGARGWGWGYALYSVANGAAAWLVLSRRL
jgi:hypothetical protein